MKIMLILPAAEHLRVYSGSEFVPKRKMLRFSVLSLTTLAALTPAEHELSVIDENVEAVDLNFPADIVGISFMTGLATRAYELARHFRSRGILTVAGGFHPTLCTDEAMENFDIVVSGEAEGIWPGVLKDIEMGDYKRLYEADPSRSLDDCIVPKRNLLAKTSQHYVTINAVQTGRGCNHACKFCSVSAFFHRNYKNRPLESVLDELSQIPRNFMFVDDNIIADREYARRLFKAMVPMEKRWISQCSIEIADDPDLLNLAKKAGCTGLFVGIESISGTNLNAMDKNFNADVDLIERIKRIHKIGIGIQAGMIVGLDSDDTGVFERTLKFLQANRIDALQLAILTPQPGTLLRKEFESAGRILDNDWSKYDYRHVVIQPARMSPRQLQNGADWLYNQFYRLDRIIIRSIRAFLRSGPITGILVFRLNMTYRYDNRREGIVGVNPAQAETWISKLVAGLRARLLPAIQ